MSGSQKDTSKTPPTATIKIAPSEQSQRQSTGADPGPGDPNAAPSVAPELVDIPDAPTPSELVVKSTSGVKSGSGLTTLQPGRSAIKSTIASSMAAGAPPTSVSGSKAGPAASNASGTNAPREATSSRPLTGPPSVGGVSSRTGAGGAGSATGNPVTSRTGAGGVNSTTGSHVSSRSGAAGGASTAAGAGSSQAGTASGRSTTGAEGKSAGASPSPSGSSAGYEPTSPASNASSQKTSPSPSQSRSPMSEGSGNVVHDEDEVGEGELEHQPSGVSAAKTIHSGQTNASSASPMSSNASQKSAEPSASSAKSEGGAISNMLKTDDPKDKKKKVTKFRYHKRITVRTTGKTSPAAVMDKVNKKARITPSTIEELDPQELMKRAGIKGNKQTHWRVRLRQTKRVTKNGKTTTQTKVAYRDSEGNKRVKLSSNPNCKKCGKKLEECKCDTNSTS